MASIYTLGKPGLRSILALALLWLIVGYLFRGSYQYGMNYDEVLRLNPYVGLVNPKAQPIDQGIYSIEIGSLKLPIMFKEYISSIFMLPMVPALFFEDPRLGLRLMEQFYFMLAVTALFLFLRRYNFYLSIAAASLLATAPYLYPEVRFGFAITSHITILTVSVFFLEKAYREDKWRYWMLAALGFALGVNIYMYFLWTLSGMAIATALLFPREFWRVTSRPKVVSAAIIGSLIGGFNFVIYNLANKGATFRLLLNGLFNREKYNQAPIDYKELPDFKEEVLSKIYSVSNVLGGDSGELNILLGLIILAALAYVLSLANAWKHGQLLETVRVYCFPALTATIIILLILVTPKSGRVGHWALVAPFLEISVVAAAFLLFDRALRDLRPIWRRTVPALLVLSVFFVSFFISNRLVAVANETRGTRLFSPAIYELYEDLVGAQEDGSGVIAVDWGFTQQIYYLSRGTLLIGDLTFRLASRDYQEARPVIASYILERYRPGSDIWFIYHEHEALAGTRSKFFRFLEDVGGELKVLKVYTGGDNTHYLAVLVNLDEMAARLRKSLTATNAESDSFLRKIPIVTAYGPRQAVVARSFNVQPNGDSAMWFSLKDVNERLEVLFDGERRRAVFSKENGIVTIAIAPEELAEERAAKIEICDMETKMCAEPIFFRVVPGTDEEAGDHYK